MRGSTEPGSVLRSFENPSVRHPPELAGDPMDLQQFCGQSPFFLPFQSLGDWLANLWDDSDSASLGSLLCLQP